MGAEMIDISPDEQPEVVIANVEKHLAILPTTPINAPEAENVESPQTLLDGELLDALRAKWYIDQIDEIGDFNETVIMCGPYIKQEMTGHGHDESSE